MNRTLRAITGAVFVLIITFSVISICQNVGKSLKVDVTEQKLYTLSAGSRVILGKLNQPIKMKLFYAKTAAMKAPDRIRFFNNYYRFVRSLLEEYAVQSGGMVKLEVIDPRPYSEEEIDAMRHGLRRFPMTEEENFFFGLVIQTEFGVEKSIPFFTPERQNFIEYDISYLIDTAITREKTKVGILSSLAVMGDNVTGYMADLMRMQGQQPQPAWGIVEHLRQQYEVINIAADANEISGVDTLLVIHPKRLSEETLFAIDQYVLKGGRTIVFVDPHCIIEQSQDRSQQMMGAKRYSSELNRLLNAWGLEMRADTFAGDNQLAIKASIMRNQRPDKIIGFLGLTRPCFSQESAITAELNEVRILFAGVLNELTLSDAGQNIQRRPIVFTTDAGNSWKVDNPFELMMLDPANLMSKFVPGDKAVAMGYQITGRLKSAFPDGIEVEQEETDDGEEGEKSEETAKLKKKITGLTEASEECVVVVFSDVDFISDLLAYQNSLFGKTVVADNSSLLLNTIEVLKGSSELISIRSRGGFRRPFVVVDAIEERAEIETAQEEAKINANIEGFRNELNRILSTSEGKDQAIIGSSITQEKRELEGKIRAAERQKNMIKLKRRERIDNLGNTLQNINMLVAPVIILIIAVVLGVHRSARRRHYISHASDS